MYRAVDHYGVDFAIETRVLVPRTKEHYARQSKYDVTSTAC